MSPLSLSSAQQEEILLIIKKSFSDFRFFDSHVAASVRKLIHHSTKSSIDMDFASNIVNRYIENPTSYQSVDQKMILDKMEIILSTTMIYLFSLNPSVQDKLYHSDEEMLEAYPEFKPFKTNDPKELLYLRNFRNFTALGLLLFQPRNKKTFLLKVCERLEGSNEEYITGTGQKPAVTRRSVIFHQESGTEQTKKKNTKRQREEVVVHVPRTIDHYNVFDVEEKSAKKRKTKVQTVTSTSKLTVKRQYQRPNVLLSSSLNVILFVDENLPVPIFNRRKSEDSFNVVVDLLYQEGLQSELKFSNPFFEDLSAESHDRLINETYSGSFTDTLATQEFSTST
jgi:hypothetical protein